MIGGDDLITVYVQAGRSLGRQQSSRWHSCEQLRRSLIAAGTGRSNGDGGPGRLARSAVRIACVSNFVTDSSAVATIKEAADSRLLTSVRKQKMRHEEQIPLKSREISRKPHNWRSSGWSV